MIISHKHKFVFIHCPRTGGSAVARAVIDFLDDNDEIDEIVGPKGMSAAILPVKAPCADCNSEKGNCRDSVGRNLASNEVKLYLNPK